MTTEEFYDDDASGLRVTDDFEKVRRQGYNVEVGDTISKAWDFIKPQLGSLIGFLIIAFIVIIIASMILGLIPFVGNILASAINAVVLAGFYYFFIKLYKEKYAVFSDFFESFQDALPLGISGLLVALITYIPLIIIGAIGYFAFDFGNYNFSDPSEMMQLMQRGVVSILIFLAVIVTTLISVLYIFTSVIIATSKVSFWEAMESSRKLVMANYSGVLGFLLVLGVLNMIGAMLCGLGTLITIPLTFASIFILYTKIVAINGGGTLGSTFYGDEKAPLDAI